MFRERRDGALRYFFDFEASAGCLAEAVVVFAVLLAAAVRPVAVVLCVVLREAVDLAAEALVSEVFAE